MAGSTVYVGSDDDKVYALDAATGQLRWSYTTGDEVVSGPAVAGGTVYVGSDDDKVYALNAATGHLRWSYTTGGVVVSGPAVAGGTVYVGSDDHKVYALNAATGDLRSSYTTGNSPRPIQLFQSGSGRRHRLRRQLGTARCTRSDAVENCDK